MAARAAPRGWHIQFYTPGTIVRDLLPFLADLEDPFVIDHMGYMLEADGLISDDFERLLGVLAQGNCWIKLSGPYRIAKSRPLSYVGPVGRALVSTRPGPADLGIRLAAPAGRAARHRRVAEPAGRLGARGGRQAPDPGRIPRSPVLRPVIYGVLFRAGTVTGFGQPGALERGERAGAHPPQ
jgi:Amidohydrolase